MLGGLGRPPALVTSPTTTVLALLGIWAGLDVGASGRFRVSVWALCRWHMELIPHVRLGHTWKVRSLVGKGRSPTGHPSTLLLVGEVRG